MKAGALEEHVGGLLSCARFETTEYTSDAHGVFGVADHQIALRKLVFLPVKGNEWGAVGAGSNNDLTTFDLIGIKGVHGYGCLEENVVGDIDDVVDGTQTDCLQTVLQPLG